MFEAIKNWFAPAQEPVAESKWDANTMTLQQPNSPATPEMNQTLTEQPGSAQSMDVQMRGGGAGEGICSGM
ncbi:hypothetical protein N7532_010801 [Penicillium argentinense]|uniref:Uncharacterized protein n=1 Tax=Penicillium argentinense TaxID=1131581 RepID=A0A9W9EQJ3_9EURO|nr:uncharacterized protein N7532_010801 [Penicillium argentinense]KAJ5086030.1 hypothetical protein N7532_010801 [Penicillium argentinense]